MRFMFLVQSAQEATPTPELMTAMHALAQEEVAAGRMIFDGGLAPAAKRLRIRARKLVVTDGPFAETKEVIGGFAVFDLPDVAAAEEMGRRFMELHRLHMPDWEGACEIRPIAGSEVERVRAAGG